MVLTKLYLINISLIRFLYPSVKDSIFLYKALQKHFKNLEALALDRDEPEKLIDHTGKEVSDCQSSLLNACGSVK